MTYFEAMSGFVQGFASLCVRSPGMLYRQIVPPPAVPLQHAEMLRAQIVQIGHPTPLLLDPLINLIVSYVPHPSIEIRHAVEDALRDDAPAELPAMPNVAERYLLPKAFLKDLLSFRNFAFPVALNGLHIKANIFKQLLEHCPHITALNLSNCSLAIDLHAADNGLHEILQFRDLDLLDLSYNYLYAETHSADPDAVHAVGDSPFLQFIKLEKLRILRLQSIFNVHGAALLPESLENLRGMKSLTELDLSHNRRIGTLDQVPLFSRFIQLRRLVVVDCCDLDPQFATQLRARRPDIEVVTEAIAAPAAAATN